VQTGQVIGSFTEATLTGSSVRAQPDDAQTDATMVANSSWEIF
jgi:hypothetical protein